MSYKHINVDRALNKITRIDNLFCGDYTIDPYQNCEFGCVYCDSANKNIVLIKNNIVELFKKEIQKMSNANIIIGSVHDPYQKIEKKEQKTRKILNLIKKNNLNCHILTKSDLVLRDIDILEKINDCNVTISVSSIDYEKNKLFEKNVSSFKKRLETVEKLNENNIKSGLALIPLIPYITDCEIKKIIEKAKKYNAKYFLYKYLELKGDQKTTFLNLIKKNYNTLYNSYKDLYKNSMFPTEEYTKKTDKIIQSYLSKYNLKNTI